MEMQGKILKIFSEVTLDCAKQKQKPLARPFAFHRLSNRISSVWVDLYIAA